MNTFEVIVLTHNVWTHFTWFCVVIQFLWAYCVVFLLCVYLRVCASLSLCAYICKWGGIRGKILEVFYIHIPRGFAQTYAILERALWLWLHPQLAWASDRVFSSSLTSALSVVIWLFFHSEANFYIIQINWSSYISLSKRGGAQFCPAINLFELTIVKFLI